MDILKIAAVVIVTTILISSLPAFDKSVASLITLSATVIVLVYITDNVKNTVETILSVLGSSAENDMSVVFKAMGISLITQFVSDIATDSGNKALANQMIFAGKIAVTAVALPLFIQVLEIIGNLLK